MWWKSFFCIVFLIKSLFLHLNVVQSQEEEAQSSFVVNFICGLGVPWEVQGGYMTTGYVMKSQYSFPVKISEWRRPPFAKSFKGRKTRSILKSMPTSSTELLIPKHRNRNRNESNAGKKRRKKASKNIDKYRWMTYKGLEIFANRLGYVGRACVLRGICEANETPFDWRSGLLGELLHILLSPSTSTDPLTRHSDNEYFHAEYLGKSKAPCDRIFSECTKSLLEEFSTSLFENF